MKIKLLLPYLHHAKGTTIELPSGVANTLISNGKAKVVNPAKVKTKA